MLKELLLQIPDCEYEEEKDLSLFSTMRLKAHGDLITVKSKDALVLVQQLLSKKKISPLILGMGANQLLCEKSRVPYLRLDFSFDKNYLSKARDLYLLPASIRLSVLSSHAVKFGLKGWENFTGIPATLGGAVFMNAGTNLGEIGDLIKKVYIIDATGEEKIVEVDENSFSYRKNNFLNTGDVVYQVEMKHLGIDPAASQKIKDYLDLRNRSQPLKEFTCGCVFKNMSKDSLTCRAGLFIDILGLKGLMLNTLVVSPKHANFIENRGNATRKEVLKLIELIKNELYLQYGIMFDTEVKYQEVEKNAF